MWRPIKEEEIVNGTAVNAFGEGDTSPYSVSTIIAVDGDLVRLARPIAYASALCDSKQPMLYAEVYETSKYKLLTVGIVWENARQPFNDAKVRTYLTGPG